MKVTKIVLTGGPCAGKTEILNKIAERFRGKITIIPEVATELLSIPYEEGGVGIPGKDLEWSQEWQDNFQAKVLKEQIKAEVSKEAEAMLFRKEEIIIICDRGILDGAAYLPGGREQLAEKFGLSIEKTLKNYDAIIHLNSLATDNQEKYEELKSTNPARFEDSDRARELDTNLKRAWEGHAQQIIIESTETPEEKTEACLEALERITRIRETNETTRENLPEIIVNKEIKVK